MNPQSNMNKYADLYFTSTAYVDEMTQYQRTRFHFIPQNLTKWFVSTSKIGWRSYTTSCAFSYLQKWKRRHLYLQLYSKCL